MQQRQRNPLVPAVVGPTASGKSELGLALALHFGGEIINLDSVQLYRRLYVATAKVRLEERRGIAHHLIDILEPTEPFTAGEYAALATRTIGEVRARGRMPILVGGSGFYLRALVNPLFESPQTDRRIRRRLQAILAARGPARLHRVLSRLDPVTAATVSPRDWSRTARALEYYFQTGNRISDAKSASQQPSEIAGIVRIIALNPPRDQLYSRINARAERMFGEGLVAEVRSLLESGIPPNAKAFQAHGYKRVVEHLQGNRSLASALEQMKLDTRHYAKRQITWWRAWPGVRWIDRFGEDPEAIAESIQWVLDQKAESAVD
jgi:tRNA dimethylallyltransferase